MPTEPTSYVYDKINMGRTNYLKVNIIRVPAFCLSLFDKLIIINSDKLINYGSTCLAETHNSKLLYKLNGVLILSALP